MELHAFDIFPAMMFFISFYGLITTENIIKSIVFTLIMTTSVVLFWMGIGAREGIVPPIIYDLAYLDNLNYMADPLPQALMLTAIIIGISVATVAITMLNALVRKYNTAEWKTMRALAFQQEESD